MFPFRTAPLNALTLTPAADAGQRRTIKLEQNTFNHVLFLVLRVTLVIAVAAAASINNRGSAAAAFTINGVNEDATDRVTADPRVLAFLGQMRSQSALSSVRLGSLATGTYNLVEFIPLHFGSPTQRDPGETAFREKNPTAETTFFVELSPTAAANIAVAGGGGSTVTVTTSSVEIAQMHNRFAKKLPLFIPYISQKLKPILGANTDEIVSLNTDKHLAALVISQECGIGECSDIINSFAFRSDIRDYVGPKKLPMETAQRISESQFGGQVYQPTSFSSLMTNYAAASVKGPHLGIDLVAHGQLSTMPEPNESNLRLEVDCQPSAFGAAGLSKIRVTTVEMVRDLASYVAPGGGVRVVADPRPLPWSRGAGVGA